MNADVKQTDLAWLLKVVPAIGVLLLCGTISIFLWETNHNWQLVANAGIVLVLRYFIVYKVREREIYTPRRCYCQPGGRRDGVVRRTLLRAISHLLPGGPRSFLQMEPPPNEPPAKPERAERNGAAQ